jgi:hypothetical protein
MTRRSIFFHGCRMRHRKGLTTTAVSVEIMRRRKRVVHTRSLLVLAVTSLAAAPARWSLQLTPTLVCAGTSDVGVWKRLVPSGGLPRPREPT